MAITIFFKTEKDESAGKLYVNGWLWFETSINNDPVREEIRTASGQKKYRSPVDVDTDIYCHIESASEPTSDGSILTTDFGTTGSETDTEYSGNGYIKSFTSATGFFTQDQNFDEHESLWTMHYTNKYTNSTPGYSPYMKVEFHKRDSSNNDTLLFSFEVNVGTFYIGNGNSVTFSPSGSVTTSDRLRIRVYGSERLPA